jgi:transposase
LATAKKRRPPAKKQSAKSAGKVLRQKQAIDLRVKGLSIRAIAEKLGVTKSQVHRDIEGVLSVTKSEAAEVAEQARKVALEQIDRAIAGLDTKLRRGHPASVMAFVRLDERRAKLLHLEKTKVEHTGADGAPLPVDARSELIERLSGLLAGAEAGAAAGADTAAADQPAEAEGAPGP